MPVLKLNDLIAYNFDEILFDILDHNHTFYTFVGGRGSTKSSFISLVTIFLISQNKDFNAVILRKVSGTLRDSVYAQMRWAISKLDADELFVCNVSPMQITYKPTGQQILFRGVDDAAKLKSLKCKNGYFALTWFEESSEFTPSEIRSVQQTIMRGGKDFWIFDSFNPPININNWKNKDILIDKPSRLIHKSDYRDVPVDWLSQAFCDEAEFLKQSNKRLYDNEYLGIATGTGDNVFDNITIRDISDQEINGFDWIYRGIDWGYSPDPCMYGEMCYDARSRKLYIFKQLKLYKCSNLQIQDKLLDLGCNPNDRITADSNEIKSIKDFRAWGWNMRAAIKGPGSVDYGFKWLQSLSEIIIDPKRCPDAIEEFTNYEYDKDRDGNVISGYPQGQEDHYMALTRYALEQVWKRGGR